MQQNRRINAGCHSRLHQTGNLKLYGRQTENSPAGNLVFKQRCNQFGYVHKRGRKSKLKHPLARIYTRNLRQPSLLKYNSNSVFASASAPASFHIHALRITIKNSGIRIMFCIPSLFSWFRINGTQNPGGPTTLITNR